MKIRRISLFILAAVFCTTAASAATYSLWKGASKVRLDNGLTVMIREDHTQPVVSVQVWVKAGSVNETPKTAGLSHFLEHLIFKGTDKYPGQEITHAVETQGGLINAGTSKEFTQFYIDIQKSGAETAVRILADAMANATMPADDIDRERPVVIEEIRRHEDNPGSILFDLFGASVFLKTPYRDPIIGLEEVIRSVSRDDIMNYYHAYYTPQNMYLSIAGDVDTASMMKLIKETFGQQKPAAALPKEPSLVEPLHAAQSNKRSKPIEQTYWLAGFVGPDIMSNDQFAADIASNIIGGGRSSRLYRVLREEKQLVFSIGSSFWSNRGSGAMTISGVFAPEKEAAVVEETQKQIELLIAKGPHPAELARAKEMVKSQWAFSLETFHEQAALMGYWEMQGRPEMTDHYLEYVDKVTAQDVVDFLKKYYSPQGLSQGIITPEAAAKP